VLTIGVLNFPAKIAPFFLFFFLLLAASRRSLLLAAFFAHPRRPSAAHMHAKWLLLFAGLQALAAPVSSLEEKWSEVQRRRADAVRRGMFHRFRSMGIINYVSGVSVG